MITKINMKNKRSLYAKLISLSFIIYHLAFSVACSDFLDIKPQSEIILEDFWNEKADVDNVVTGCYSAMLSDGVRRRMMVWGEFRSDNVQAGENIHNDVNLQNVFKENINALNPYTTWDGFYDVINRCNTVLKYAPGVAAIDPGYTEGDLKATIAEVTALRSLCYFYLIRTFRDVPYSTEAFTDDDQTMDLPATPFYEVLDTLISDLERVKSDAVVRYPDTKPRYQTQRITRDAIIAMLSEMYLWKGDYQKCIDYAEQVINSKKEAYEEELGTKQRGSNQAAIEARLNGYPLVNDRVTGTSESFGTPYRTIFIDGVSRETIFELGYEEEPEASNMINNSAISAFYGHSNANGLVKPSSYVTEDIKKSSNRTVFQDVLKTYDVRMYQNCNADREAITKYATKSFTATVSGNEVRGSYTFFTEKNNGSKWIIYRLPDIMLLEAEALCQLMQDGSDSATIAHNKTYLEKAFTLVNAVNKRSICKTKLEDADTLKAESFNTRTLMEELVMRERQCELMYEGKRWYDLVRYSMRLYKANPSQNTPDVGPLGSAVTKRDDVNSQFAMNFFKKIDAIFWPYNNEEMKVNRNLKPNPAFGSGESTSMEKAK